MCKILYVPVYTVLGRATIVFICWTEFQHKRKNHTINSTERRLPLGSRDCAGPWIEGWQGSKEAPPCREGRTKDTGGALKARQSGLQFREPRSAPERETHMTVTLLGFKMLERAAYFLFKEDSYLWLFMSQSRKHSHYFTVTCQF